MKGSRLGARERRDAWGKKGGGPRVPVKIERKNSGGTSSLDSGQTMERVRANAAINRGLLYPSSEENKRRRELKGENRVDGVGRK